MERTLRRRAAAAPGVGSILVTSAPAVEWLAVDHGTALFFGGPTPFLLALSKEMGSGKTVFQRRQPLVGFLREQKVTRRRPWQGLIELQGPRPRLDVGPGKGASRDFSLIPLFSEKGGIFQKIIDNSSFGWYNITAALNGNEKREDRHTGELGAKRAL